MTIPIVQLGFFFGPIPSIKTLKVGTPPAGINKPQLKHNLIFIPIFQSFFQNGKTIVLWRLTERLEVFGKYKYVQMCFSKQEQGLTSQFTRALSPRKEASDVVPGLGPHPLHTCSIPEHPEPEKEEKTQTSATSTVSKLSTGS